MEQLLYRLFKHKLKKHPSFKFATIGAGDKFMLRPGMMCLVRPYEKTLGIYNANGARIVDKDVGYTIAFCCDLNEGGTTGSDFRAFFTCENSVSLLDLTNILITAHAVCKDGAYLYNNSANPYSVYYVERG